MKKYLGKWKSKGKIPILPALRRSLATPGFTAGLIKHNKTQKVNIMGTRANIIIRDRDIKFYLYRHWDGYPAGCGYDLAINLRNALGLKHGRASTYFINHLNLRKNGDCNSGDYQFTDSIHGDIEHLYEIYFINDRDLDPLQCVMIEHTKITYDYPDCFKEGTEIKETQRYYGLPAFADFIHREVAKQNEWIESYNSKQSAQYDLIDTNPLVFA